jgi:hypothetical protein
VNAYLKLVLGLLLLVTACLSHAQVIKEDTTTNPPFFAAKKFNSKCYVGIEGTATQILKKKAGMTLGLSLSWVINHKYVVTARYNVLSTPLNVQKLVAPDRSDTIPLRYQHAGLGFSYILFHNKKFSLQPELSAGWAMIKYEYAGGTWYRHFGVITPAVYGIYNCTKYFRFGVGLNYRITAGATLIKDSYLSGIGGMVFMRVGTF